MAAELAYLRTPVARAVQRIGRGIAGWPKRTGQALRRMGLALWHGICAVGRTVRELWQALIHGDAFTRLSFLLMGCGCLRRGQVVKGLLFLLAEAAFLAYMVGFGAGYLMKFGTLGTEVTGRVWDEEAQIYRYTAGDNSVLILLYSVVTLLFCAGFLWLYVRSVRACYRAERTARTGERLPTLREEWRALLDERFHVTLLTVPTLLIAAFTVLPILFMILLAFTNFDSAHQPPGNLFTWTGLETFRGLLWDDPVKSYTLWKLLGWTLVWAIFATLTNYIGGILLALLIQQKGLRLKKLWRTLFVVTIAVPQFVTLLLMSKLLADQGTVNQLLQAWELTTEPVHFLTDATLARITVIAVNLWVGIPYTLLIATGILINVPEELYESARIDGAGPARVFFRITLPYMLYITTPYLITQFVGNINNFNLIFLLTGGEPATLEYFRAGKTDLLVTWLYKQTVNFQNYNLAAAIGILVFILSAVFSLTVYHASGSSRREGEFA